MLQLTTHSRSDQRLDKSIASIHRDCTRCICASGMTVRHSHPVHPLISAFCPRVLHHGKGRNRQLTLHADNGGAMRSATLEVRLEGLGVLRSFSRPRVSNDNPYSEALFRIDGCRLSSMPRVLVRTEWCRQENRSRSRRLSHWARIPCTATRSRYQARIRPPRSIRASGIALRKLIRLRSVAGDVL